MKLPPQHCYHLSKKAKKLEVDEIRRPRPILILEIKNLNLSRLTTSINQMSIQVHFR
jgi:hypothetical protein